MAGGGWTEEEWRAEVELLRRLLREARELCGMATGDPEDTATQIDEYFEKLEEGQ